MGEYAMRISDRTEIKIGTCEQMYYLRADQVHLVEGLRGSVDPRQREQAEQIRFRFPFPQEDRTLPGDFDDYDYGLGLYGIEPPEDIDHYSVQFTRNYPQSGGVILSIPCPRGKEGKANLVKVSYNGYNGPVHIHSQRLVDGKLVLILRCGDCGALYRVPTLDEAKPVLDVLEKYAADGDREAKISSDHYKQPIASQGDFYREIARRIVAGYTEPNFWTTAPQATPRRAFELATA